MPRVLPFAPTTTPTPSTRVLMAVSSPDLVSLVNDLQILILRRRFAFDVLLRLARHLARPYRSEAETPAASRHGRL